MERRGQLGGGSNLSGTIRSTLPTWRAFGPGAASVLGWDAPRDALPRTALCIVEGLGRHWSSHMTRLRMGGIQLGWDLAWLSEMEPELVAWTATTGMAACRLQLFPDAISVRLEAIPAPPSSYRLLATAHPLGDIRGDVRATLKGLMGAWDLQALRLAHAKLADDALLFWPDLTLVESAIAAIGLQVGETLLLPPLEGRVASITEAFELPLWAASRGLLLQRRPIRMEEVLRGQLWCMNAVRGLWQAEVVQL